MIGRSASTISRELQRNSLPKGGYKPASADRIALSRRNRLSRSERENRGSKTRSKVRTRVEHVFGVQSNYMGGKLVHSIGVVRAMARIGLKNLAYNMRRLVQLEQLAAAAPT